MKELTKKRELKIALQWIAAYVLLFSFADGASQALGTEKLLTAPLALMMTVILSFWIFTNGLQVRYGLIRPRTNAKEVYWYLPLIVLVSVNLWGGVSMRFSPKETLLYVATMFGVGVLEEVIFRGMLFRTLARDSLPQAIAVSSITFGIGHIVNLLTGATLIETLLQIVYATAIGYLFTILFLRTGSLIPCILAHGVFNALSAFGAERSVGTEIAVIVVLVVLPILYAQWVRGKGDWFARFRAAQDAANKADAEREEAIAKEMAEKIAAEKTEKASAKQSKSTAEQAAATVEQTEANAEREEEEA